MTLREIVTLKQIRISLKELVEKLLQLIDGRITWEDMLASYPIFESQEKLDE